MKRWASIALQSIVCLSFLASAVQAQSTFPVINSATLDYAHGTVTIAGANFGTSPLVKLGTTTLTVQSATSTLIGAAFPSATPLSSFTPGTYFLRASFSNGTTAIFTLALGAIGPQGPIGFTGATGATGAIGPAGATGPTGATGANGAIGATGPVGATGAAGATGATGATGAAGPAGTTGPQGPIGLTGAAGAPGPLWPTGPTGATGATGQQRPQGGAGTSSVSNLIGWWPGDGNAKDVVHGNNGALLNGASFAPGEVGQAFALNGAGQYVDLGNASQVQLSPGDFTVDAWVNFASTQGDMDIVNKMDPNGGAPNADGWRLIKQNDNRFWFCFGGAGGGNGCGNPSTTVFSSTVATTGVWYHVAGVKNRNSISIYINGQLESTQPLGTFVDTNRADLLIGGFLISAFLNGSVDEGQIYNRALNSAEIALAFKTPGASGPTGPQGPQGLIGFIRATGAACAQGLVRTQGPTGLTGAAGITGATGSQGIQGLTGPAGWLPFFPKVQHL